MSLRREAEALGLSAYTFDVSPDGEPKLKRAAPMDEPERSADELISEIQRFDSETDRLVDQVRSDRARLREQLEQQAAEAMRREQHGDNDDADDEE